MNCGSVKAGEAVLLGPDSNGNYTSTVVKSMQRKRFDPFLISSAHKSDEMCRATVTTAEAGQCVSLALKRIRRGAVRKGMVIVNKSDSPPRGKSCLDMSK
jgi:GTPase